MNKEIRKARLNHTAKYSRKYVMKNQFTYLLVRSDPIVSSVSFRKQRVNNETNLLTEEVKKLLLIE